MKKIPLSRNRFPLVLKGDIWLIFITISGSVISYLGANNVAAIAFGVAVYLLYHSMRTRQICFSTIADANDTLDRVGADYSSVLNENVALKRQLQELWKRATPK